MRISDWSSDVCSSDLHFDAALARKPDHRLPGQAVEEAVGRRRVEGAVLHEKRICAGAFGHLSAPVEHQRVVIAARLRLVLGQCADHVKPGGFGLDRGGIGRGTTIFGRSEERRVGKGWVSSCSYRLCPYY